ncbi:MAG: MmgE/PrpD family protein [Acetobacteraceae bacterium]|jgi:2-methylcitrate dehydratase PrpD
MNTDDRTRVATGLQELTQWAATYPPSHLPPDVLRRAAAILADDVGAMVAARDEPEVARLHAATLRRTAQPEATIFRGGHARTDRMSAAVANAVAACWLELDEGYRPVPCHAGLHILPALLAEAEATDRPVRDVLTALALGYEVETRIARCWNAPALVVHTHAQYCAVGAAMGVALLRRLDPASLLNVLAMASTFVNAGPRNHALSGALVRNAWPAAGAWSGMMSVELHGCGFGGNPDAPGDVYAAILGCDTRPQELRDGLGGRWAVFDGYTKAYACCQHTHSAAEAALALHPALPASGALDAIETVVVETHELATRLLNRQPETTLAARFSLPHVVASALLRGDAGAAACAAASLHDPAIAALRERIEVTLLTPALPPPHDRATRISIQLRDQRRLHSLCRSAIGSPDRPLDAAAFQRKLHDATAPVYPAAGSVLGDLMRGEPALLDLGFAAFVAKLCDGAQPTPSTPRRSA